MVGYQFFHFCEEGKRDSQVGLRRWIVGRAKLTLCSNAIPIWMYFLIFSIIIIIIIINTILYFPRRISKASFQRRQILAFQYQMLELCRLNDFYCMFPLLWFHIASSVELKPCCGNVTRL